MIRQKYNLKSFTFDPIVNQWSFDPTVNQWSFDPTVNQWLFDPIVNQWSFDPTVNQWSFDPIVNQWSFDPTVNQWSFDPTVNQWSLPLQTFPSSEGWPFPAYLGACGRYIVQEYGGRSLEEFLDAPFEKRVSIFVWFVCFIESRNSIYAILIL